MNRIEKIAFINYELQVSIILFVLFIFCGLISPINAQSTQIDYPTAVSTNEVSGKISARDLGDSRLTAYYYTFNGNQGDIFINVSASNFNGDIDIYAAEGLRPLTKITFYADSSVTETGRVVYLRKPEKLILRVEGRTPDDNPASFTIKFAGSFVAVQDNGQSEQPKLPEVKNDNSTGIRVNSVGTIIRPEPTPTPEVKETVAETEKNNADNAEKTSENEIKVVVTDSTEANKTDDSNKTAETEPEKEVVTPVTKRRTTSRNARNRTRPATTPKPKTPAPAKTPKKTDVAKTEPEPPKPNPLENVRLIVLMKDGDKIEFPMTEVFRFSMNNGVLTIITKDGKIHRKSILEVQKMTVE